MTCRMLLRNIGVGLSDKAAAHCFVDVTSEAPSLDVQVVS